MKNSSRAPIPSQISPAVKIVMNRRLNATSDPGSTLPTRFMPAANDTSPIAPTATVSASSRARLPDNLVDSSMRRACSAVLLHEFQAFRAQPQKRDGFVIETRALVSIPERLAND